MSKKKSFLYYSLVSVSEGLSTKYKISELCLERSDIKLNKKMQKLPTSIWNSKKIKNDDVSCDMELLQKEDKLNPSIYIMCTCIVHMLIKYLDRNQSKVKMEVFQMKKIGIYLNSMLNYWLPNIRCQGEPLGCCCINRAQLKIQILLMQ